MGVKILIKRSFGPLGSCDPKVLLPFKVLLLLHCMCLVTDKHLSDQGLPESQFLCGSYCCLAHSLLKSTWWKGVCPALVWTWFVATKVYVEPWSSICQCREVVGPLGGVWDTRQPSYQWTGLSSQEWLSCCNSVSLPHAPACLPTTSPDAGQGAGAMLWDSRTPRQNKHLFPL